MLRVTLLGPVTAVTEQHAIDVGSPRQCALFTVLAMNAGRVVSREDLIDAVWGASPPVTVESSVYTYVARLRRSLEPDRPLRAPSGLLVNHGSGYSLQIPRSDVDAHTFGEHLTRAANLHSRANYRAALVEVDAALGMWKGPPLDGAVGPFAEATRLQLNEQRFTARQDRAEYLLALGRHAEAIRELSDLVRWQPLQERLRRLRMLAFYRTGRRADALAEFREIRRLLVAELGVEPSEDLQRCHEQILRSDPALDTSSSALPWVAGPTPLPRPAPAQLPRDITRFSGRTAELAHLHSIVHECEASGEAAVVTISGQPGVGKSALAIRFAHELSAGFPDGHLYLDLAGRGPRPVSPADALAMLMAELGDDRPLPASVDRRAALFRSAVWGKRVLVLLDDAASTEQVRALLPGTASCTVVITSRRELTGLAAHDGARGVVLRALPDDDAATLVRRLVGHRLDHAHDQWAINRLIRVCDGLPLALRVAAERVRTRPEPSVHAAVDRLLTEDGVLELLGVEDEASSIRTVFATLYDRLAPRSAAMLLALGIYRGRDVSLGLAAELAQQPVADARAALRNLVESSVLTQVSPDRYRLSTLVHAFARERADDEVPTAHHACVARRAVRYYLRQATAAVKVLSGPAGPDGNEPGTDGDRVAARRWIELELDHIPTAVEMGRRWGVPETAELLQLAGRDLREAERSGTQRRRNPGLARQPSCGRSRSVNR